MMRSPLSHGRPARALPALAALLVLATACGGKDAQATRRKAAASTHAATVTTGANCPETSVHAKHINRFACTVCHPTGGNLGFSVPYTFPGGTTTAGGTLVRGTETTPTTCAVGCHSVGVTPPREIAWNAPGPLACTSCHTTSTFPAEHPAVAPDAPRAECERCHAGGSHMGGTVEFASHPASFTDRTSTEFHAYAANRGFAECRACHGQDLSGGAVETSCGQCHDQTEPTFVSWKNRCTMCHGGTDDQTGAPPRATWGNSADAIRIGAHTTHLSSDIAPAFDCNVCHVKPADALATAHVDGNGIAEVTFGGTAVIGMTPVWDRTRGACASTYCHKGPGASNPIPEWTKVGTGEADCGACHGMPPPSPHPVVINPDRPSCSVCHELTITALGEIIPPASGGKHLDGLVEATGHPPEWMDRTSAGFHAFPANRGLGGCTSCHGAALDGANAPVTSVSCATAGCHGPSWETRCTMCHGGADNQTGAPPRTSWGKASDPLNVGAHSTHAQGTAISPPMDCNQCHLKPATAFTTGHIDGGAAEVVFGGHAVAQSTPAWDRAAGTCASTHCHSRPGATNPTPTWTRVGQGEAACGACHGLPPPEPLHPVVSADLTTCRTCHDVTMDAAGTVIPPSAGGKHADGIVEAGGHAGEWSDRTSDGFHAYAANRSLADCGSCHGANLDGVGGSAPGCQACHGESWKTSCTMCHGGTHDQTGAPPRTVWGKASDPVRVGAHTRHVQGSATAAPIACAICHPVPASATTPGHVDLRDIADVRFTGVATTGTTAAWNRAGPTCTTYCHGATLAGGSHPAPVWTGGPSQATCGSCHGAPPNTGAHWHAPYGSATCGECHGFGYDSGMDLGLHLNGRKDVGGSIEVWDPQFQTCVSACHGYATW